MQTPYLLFTLLIISILAYFIGKMRSATVVEGALRELHSLPAYYGYYTALWGLIPGLFIILTWLSFEPAWLSYQTVAALPEEIQSLPSSKLNLQLNKIKNFAAGMQVAIQVDPIIAEAAERYNQLRKISRTTLTLVVLICSLAGIWLAHKKISKDYRARNVVEKIMIGLMIIASMIAIFTTIGIVASVVFESVLFFKQVPFFDFLFGLEWSPQTALRADQIGSSGAFGAVPLFAGTLLISSIALIVAVPIGLMSAIYLSEFAGSKLRATAKPTLEILAGIPTVVYGFFAALTVAPFIRETGESWGWVVSSESALAAGLVMGIMIIPFVSSLSDDVINAVPQSLRDAAYALGATQAETIKQVILPAALPGIVGSILLAASRAIGETMIVVMAAGLAANLTANPLEAVTTVTVQIVTLLVGDQEFDSPKTLAAFALGLMLFVVTLALNVIALHIVRKYREQYE
ncbi:phosphate ABC transporter permease subunit PstC [Methylotuvimicrobium alcaliphilum]|uniref:Phosphate transport system permease protein n=1 Tax=Methylotuvimicrobium alcaliphilum (strain DSM 19304 / NCIMB 14124 / VKM B-2133 / 20Z) TaxID=1091494 RepID=G4T2A8_META2|nr:phosphate ABC transporter permease subunit PstC [Methylotuvimicrobium alcaliphilum]CCE23548.1 ABC phosphate transport system, permease component [Methylotuvimicrobium alcaliphilum 20Z]